jgi:uncharacterized protein YbaP (TraB family)
MSLLAPFVRGRAAVSTALLMACAFGSVTESVSAQEPDHPAKPLLWKIEGKGLEEPSYLFGTIHLGSGPLKKLHPAAATALDSAEFVYTEISLDPAVQLGMAQVSLRKDNKTLSESIGEELAEQLKDELKRINPALDLAPFEQFKTWVIAVSLQVLPSQLKGEKAVDLLVWETANKAGKIMAGLEKPEDQIAIFDEFNEQEQVAFLAESLKTMREDRAADRNTVDEITEAYIAGDLERIVAEVQRSMKGLAESENKEIGERLMKRLLEDRDRTMSATILQHLGDQPKSTHFFAVGTGHLAGETSIRSYLEKDGYTVTRILE